MLTFGQFELVEVVFIKLIVLVFILMRFFLLLFCVL